MPGWNSARGTKNGWIDQVDHQLLKKLKIVWPFNPYFLLRRYILINSNGYQYHLLFNNQLRNILVVSKTDYW